MLVLVLTAQTQWCKSCIDQLGNIKPGAQTAQPGKVTIFYLCRNISYICPYKEIEVWQTDCGGCGQRVIESSPKITAFMQKLCFFDFLPKRSNLKRF